MAKSKASTYGLKFGHPTDFRRTVTVGKGDKAQRVVLVFQPNTPYSLTDQEIAGCQDIIDGGLLVEWETDERGRQMRPGTPPEAQPPKSAQVEVVGPVAKDTEADANGKDIKLADLELTDSTRSSLQEAGLTDVAKIEAYREKHDGLVGIPGIGPAKAEEIDEAIAAWE